MTTNKNSILRLSKYKNALNRFKDLGLVKIFSDYLGDAVGVTAAQVRKDFSLFGISGNKRGGYGIDSLLEKLNTILGKNVVQPVILVGAGNIGQALIKYSGFEKEGIRIVAAFDSDQAKLRPAGAVPILPVQGLVGYVAAHGIKIAIICVPEAAAQQVFDVLRNAGVSGFLNFAPLRLRADNGCVVNNVNLELELENVIYFVNVFEKSGMRLDRD
jgi:redox-sensing transcriptional repressor